MELLSLALCLLLLVAAAASAFLVMCEPKPMVREPRCGEERRRRQRVAATQDLEQPAAGGREGRDGGFLSDTNQEN